MMMEMKRPKLMIIMTKMTVIGNLTMRTMRNWSFLQEDVLCSMQHKAGIPASWMLLDSQSTVDILCNTNMLTSIYDSKRHLVLYCTRDMGLYGTIRMVLPISYLSTM